MTEYGIIKPKEKIRRGKKIKQRFSLSIIAPSNLLLKKGFYTSAIILLCCGIDYLSKFHSGNLDYSDNKRNYIEFLKKYFPLNRNQEDFYKLIRSGLIHSYYLEDRYVIGKDPFGEHFKYIEMKDKNAIVINPWRLKGEVRVALFKFLKEIEKDDELYKNYLKVFEKIKLKNSVVNIRSRRKNLTYQSKISS